MTHCRITELARCVGLDAYSDDILRAKLIKFAGLVIAQSALEKKENDEIS